ncbi:MAG TPA: glycosyltransferase family 2 protein [Anaerolineaceae bacterium]|nr:glycosyltransferase family 2 protein [Anaerolineaceae bacterium]
MPLISIIVPCFNEENTIQLLLDALGQQTVSHSCLEIVIADGLSTDGTHRAVQAFQQQHPELKIVWVENPRRNIPSGLNAALAAAAGEVIVRLDAHSIPAPDYVERCLAGLEAGLGENVGGVWEIRPGGAGWMARSIAVAAAHPLGVGDARYRISGQAGEVDTVPFGAFRHEVLDRIGRYDETLLSNEDYELNARLRKQGGRVYLDPAIRSGYFARATLSALARQYFRYGYWKLRMLRRYPDTLRWRQALPPLLVLSLVLLGLAALFSPFFRVLWLVEIGLYALALLVAGGLTAARKREPALLLGLPLAIATMHLAWGAGFLVSLLDFKRNH